MQFKKWASMGFIFALCFMIISGCSTNNNIKEEPAPGKEAGKTDTATKPESDSKQLDPVTLKIMLPGDQPKDYEAVKAEIEKRLADTLNVKIDITYVPWSDLATKTQVTLAAGEPYDLIYDAPWLHMNQMIAAGYYEPLDELIEKYGETIVKTRPQKMWDANKFNGKIMGVPLGIFMVQGHSYLIRKDLREQLSLPPIKTYEDLIKYAYAVKEKFPEISPITPAGSDAEKGYSWAAFRQNDATDQIRPTHADANSMVLYYKNNDGKVYNMFDQKDPLIWSWITEARKLYQDKIINQDVMSIKDWNGEFIAGKSAVIASRSFIYEYWQHALLQKNVAEGTMENVKLLDITPKKNIINFQMDNFISVPAVSKNKERAIQFLNWANEKENYDLIEHGIPGEEWEAVGDDKYKDLTTDSHGIASFSLIWNPVHERFPETDDEETIAYKKFVGDGDNFTADILTGFSFNGEPVKNELAQYSAIQSKYYASLLNGVVDPDTYWTKFQGEAAGALKKIQVELQKQIDSFLATQ
ncbi:ABC transporter substrate-binding protein [Paenibacillus nasutitermitis]|uniref:ABC transporter substrate binding lipoprotein n=1 Tax=Paenibacillus nasutitermitis TaxID=1652958 RepID=A0A917DQ21_9BACL|nr:ABC transporter substrate-binding protein [Paenibacillus nasutitermitis]GGD59172.1 putative ABC transporter substrate binding lipoprotein [Paenibacillus nasutitermitis]